jgi:hypothetical protein
MNIEEIYGKYIEDSATTCWFPTAGDHFSMVNYLNELCDENILLRPDLFILSDLQYDINDDGKVMWNSVSNGNEFAMLEENFEVEQVFRRIDDIDIRTREEFPYTNEEQLISFYQINPEELQINIQKREMKEAGVSEEDMNIIDLLGLFEDVEKQTTTQIHEIATERENTAVLYKHNTSNFHLLLVASDNNQIDNHPTLMPRMDYLVYYGPIFGSYQNTEINCRVLFQWNHLFNEQEINGRQVIEMNWQDPI